MIRSVRVKAKKRYYACDKCGSGNLEVYEDEAGFKTYNGHKILHICPKCNFKKYLNREYPYIHYEEE